MIEHNQTIRQQIAEKLFVFDLFVWLALKGLNNNQLVAKLKGYGMHLNVSSFTHKYPAGINLLKVNAWRRSGAFIINFKHISHLVLVFLLLTFNM